MGKLIWRDDEYILEKGILGSMKVTGVQTGLIAPSKIVEVQYFKKLLACVRDLDADDSAKEEMTEGCYRQFCEALLSRGISSFYNAFFRHSPEDNVAQYLKIKLRTREIVLEVE